MTLNYTSTMHLPAELTLSQKTLFNATLFDAQVFQSLTTDMRNKVMFGARVTDGTHIVYFIFSDTTSQRSVSTYPQNTTVNVPLGSSVWTGLRIDPVSIWNVQGWSSPREVELAFFLQSNADGVYYANLREIQPLVVSS